MQCWWDVTGFRTGTACSLDTTNLLYGTFSTPSTSVVAAGLSKQEFRIVFLDSFLKPKLIKKQREMDRIRKK